MSASAPASVDFTALLEVARALPVQGRKVAVSGDALARQRVAFYERLVGELGWTGAAAVRFMVTQGALPEGEAGRFYGAMRARRCRKLKSENLNLKTTNSLHHE